MVPLSRLFVSVLACSSLALAQQNLTVCDRAFSQSSYRPDDTWARLAHQGKDGWLFGEMDWYVPSATLDSKPALKQLVDAFKKQGIQLVVVDVPPRLPIHQNQLNPANRPRSFSVEQYRKNYAAFHKELESIGIIAPNLLEDGLKYKAGPYFQKTDHHWTTEAAKHVADLVAKEIKKLPAYKNIPRMAFTLTSTKKANNGSYARMANKICNTTFPDETINSYRAVAKEQGGLLDDSNPDVVVLGTSFSERHEYTDDHSFPETLKYSLQSDVLDAAVEGGGSFAAMEAYLMSEAYKTHKPKVIVWENTHYMGELNNTHALWRMVPLARGGCSKVVWSGKGQLSRTTSIVLPKGLKLGPNHALKLKFSDTKILGFSTRLYYGPDEIQVQTDRSWRIPNTGEFHTLLVRPDALDEIELNFRGQNPSGTYEASLCQLK